MGIGPLVYKVVPAGQLSIMNRCLCIMVVGLVVENTTEYKLLGQERENTLRCLLGGYMASGVICGSRCSTFESAPLKVHAAYGARNDIIKNNIDNYILAGLRPFVCGLFCGFFCFGRLVSSR